MLIPLAGCSLSAETSEGGAVGLGRPAPEVAAVRRDLCGQALRVRNRLPGDSFRPVGVGGRKKLQDFFVDRKVPREQRDTVPLVVDGQDRIVWVVGESVAEEFRVTDPSEGVILLKVRHLGGVG